MTNEPPADTRDMVMAHDMFRREIGQAPALVLGVGPRDIERARIVADHIALVDTILYHHHHGEDEHLWPLLRARAGEQVEEIVRVMEGQHEKIDKINAEVSAALAAWQTTADLRQGATLADLIERQWRGLCEHMAMEEEQVLPLIEQHLTAAEWNQVVVNSSGDVAPEQMPLIFGMIAHEGDPDVVRDIVANMPPEVGSVIVDLAAKAFAEHSLRLYGTAAVPTRGIAN
jgi:hemerythrin-like domain-containing protein